MEPISCFHGVEIPIAELIFLTDANSWSDYLAKLELKDLATCILIHRRWVDSKDHLHFHHFLWTRKTQTQKSLEVDLE